MSSTGLSAFCAFCWYKTVIDCVKYTASPLRHLVHSELLTLASANQEAECECAV